MLEIFEMVSDLGDALFTLGDVGVTSEEFDFLDSLNMTVGDKFMMTFAPLAKGSDYAKALTQKMIGFHASGRECRIADLFIMPSTAPVTSTELHIFEQYHKVLTCYLWLSFKFPATYIDYPVALETKAKCEELIEKGLDNMKRLGRGKVRWAPSRSNSKTSESFKSRLLAEPTVVPVETEATLMRST
ncbi:ATP-dependent RNA helicase supv3l1, mitochondrial [Tieghemiomyces parasiticus]|uniref:ATP-dependent RNA helicase supv3l1, mitochondrial n=1 Tax=Tieghemiomyces parasiticus TaxID=78921 RepID=A0A9W8A7P8_9FUNG|nr:ATP-dependent RNA helicase supv3l1, mitochondrial [Tieghemiomyces parasiticus]